MGHFCDGRASLVVGTHTHVPTADHQILPGGTAFMSDVGMTGDYDSVIGMTKDEPLNRFLRTHPDQRASSRRSAPATLCAARGRDRRRDRPRARGSPRCGSAAGSSRRGRRSGTDLTSAALVCISPASLDPMKRAHHRSIVRLAQARPDRAPADRQSNGTRPWPDIPSSRTSCTARGGRTRSSPSCSASWRARSRSRPSSACPTRRMNARLRAAIIAARAENMPKDNIERAIKKATGQRRRELRRDPLRGLRPGRRRRHRRGADRQPQPHRRRGALDLHQERRQPRRDRRGVVHVRPCRRGRVRRQGRRAPTPCWRPRSRPAPRTWSSSESGHEIYTTHGSARATVAKALEAKFGEPRKAALVWKPQNTVAGRRRAGREAAQADRDASTSTTTCRTSTPISRFPTR